MIDFADPNPDNAITVQPKDDTAKSTLSSPSCAVARVRMESAHSFIRIQDTKRGETGYDPLRNLQNPFASLSLPRKRLQLL